MDKKATARRLLGTMTNFEERLAFIIEAQLEDELISMLPELIQLNRCSLEVFNERAPLFIDHKGEANVHGLAYLHLRILQMPTRSHWSINFAGLMASASDQTLAGAVIQALVSKRLQMPDELWYLIDISEAELYAARCYCPQWSELGKVELYAARNALKGKVAVTKVLQMLPGKHSTHGVQPQLQLGPVVRHLLRCGVEEEELHRMFISLIHPDNIPSLDKLIALLGPLPESKIQQVIQERKDDLIGMALKFHFGAIPYRESRMTNMHWLLSYCDKLVLHGEKAREVFVEVLSHGRVSAVLQFLHADARTRKTHWRKEADAELHHVWNLLPQAFDRAMQERRYGIAAALGQSEVEDGEGWIRIHHSRAQLALECAMSTNQRITLAWDHVLLP